MSAGILKRALACMLLAALSLSAAGCASWEEMADPLGELSDFYSQENEQPEPEPLTSFTLPYFAGESLDPITATEKVQIAVGALLYEKLFALDEHFVLRPLLAESCTYDAAARTYTLTLRSGVTFSDGTPLTARDVAASLERARSSARYAARLAEVSSVRVQGDTVLIAMSEELSTLAWRLDIPIVKASEVTADTPLGTGPYSLEDGIGGKHLQRVVGWWCSSDDLVAKDSSIALVEAESPSQIRDEFEFSGLSVVCTNPQTDSYADYRCDFELWEVDSGFMMYIGCNVTYSKFFDDGTLRTFLTYGIDRQTLVDDNYGGLALPTTLPISPMSPYYSKSLATNYDYDEMRFIDAASKFRVPTNDKGVPRTLQLLVNSDDSARLRCARNIAATLTELGLACETVESPTSVYEARLQAANYDIYLGITKLPTTADLSEFYRPWGEMSWGGLANETIYNMVNQSLADRGNYYNLHKLVADDGRIIPVMAGYYAIYAKRGVLSDLNPARDNVFYYTLGKTMESSKVATQFS